MNDAYSMSVKLHCQAKRQGTINRVNNEGDRDPVILLICDSDFLPSFRSSKLPPFPTSHWLLLSILLYILLSQHH